ncbi:MAG: hypothetical protein IID46_02655 [Planctomycetes bacterium]|nr:hypothetical protein [Planctomycetota bacterium]
MSMIETFESRGKWLLARGVKNVGTRLITGAGSASARRLKTFAECWSEEKGWVPNARLGTHFFTKEDAQQYLRLNRDRLEAT